MRLDREIANERASSVAARKGVDALLNEQKIFRQEQAKNGEPEDPSTHRARNDAGPIDDTKSWKLFWKGLSPKEQMKILMDRRRRRDTRSRKALASPEVECSVESPHGRQS